MTVVRVHGEEYNLWLRGADRCVRGLRKETRGEGVAEYRKVPMEYGAFIDGVPVGNDRKLEDGDIVEFWPVVMPAHGAGSPAGQVDELNRRIQWLEAKVDELELTIQRLLKDDTVALRKEL